MLVQILLVDNRLTCRTASEQLATGSQGSAHISSAKRQCQAGTSLAVTTSREAGSRGLDGIFSTAIGLAAKCGSTHLTKKH